MKFVFNVESDLVAVVDTLSRADRQKFDITRPLIDGLGRLGLQQERAEVGNVLGLKAALAHFRDKAVRGTKFCLHFVAHGCEDGIAIGEGQDLLTWEAFRSELRLMNDAMQGQMTVNMTSCRGLYGVRIVDVDDPSFPFFGLVGPKEDLAIPDAREFGLDFYRLQLEARTSLRSYPN